MQASAKAPSVRELSPKVTEGESLAIIRNIAIPTSSLPHPLTREPPRRGAILNVACVPHSPPPRRGGFHIRPQTPPTFKEVPMIFADKLMALRKKSGWSQEELAEKLGVTRQSVSKWEGAQSVPDIDKILQLSRLFGVTTDYLLKDELGEPEYTARDDARKGAIRAVAAVYWLVVVAIFLFYTFGPYGNGQPQYSWFIWAIAGVIFAAVMVVMKAVQRHHN